MKKNQFPDCSFDLLHTIEGVTGGSGLVYKDNTLCILADDSNTLFTYNLGNNRLGRVRLKSSEPPGQTLKKSLKPDFEAIAQAGEQYFIFGSGSAENRFNLLELDSDLTPLKRTSLKPLYTKMMETAGIHPEDFNIEGVVIHNSTAYFFNRGNGPGQKNGIVTVENPMKADSKVSGYYPVKLPDIKGFSTTFSDAILYEENFYFLATAENTESVYHDGEIIGSAIGIMDSKTFEMKDFIILTEEYKLEGLTFYYKEESTLYFLLTDDPDNNAASTTLFKLSIDTGSQR